MLVRKKNYYIPALSLDGSLEPKKHFQKIILWHMFDSLSFPADLQNVEFGEFRKSRKIFRIYTAQGMTIGKIVDRERSYADKTREWYESSVNDDGSVSTVKKSSTVTYSFPEVSHFGPVNTTMACACELDENGNEIPLTVLSINNFLPFILEYYRSNCKESSEEISLDEFTRISKEFRHSYSYSDMDENSISVYTVNIPYCEMKFSYKDTQSTASLYLCKTSYGGDIADSLQCLSINSDMYWKKNKYESLDSVEDNLLFWFFLGIPILILPFISIPKHSLKKELEKYQQEKKQGFILALEKNALGGLSYTERNGVRFNKPIIEKKTSISNDSLLAAYGRKD